MKIDSMKQIFHEHILLSEAYYGKNEVLLRCEKLFDKALKSRGGVKEIKEIEGLLQELFNFKKLVISTMPLSLAMTIPVTTYKLKHIAIRLKMEKSDTGIQFRTEDNVEAIIFIDLAFMYAFKFTGAECIAILLHEIAHSMSFVMPQSQLMNAIGALIFTASIFGPIINFFSKQFLNAIEKIDKGYNNLIDTIGRESRRLQAILKRSKITQSSLSQIFSIIYHLSHIIMNRRGESVLIRILKIIKNNVEKAIIPSSKSSILLVFYIAGFIFRLGKYKDEALSDHISTMYGYGSELSSAFVKLHVNLRELTYDNVVFRLLRLPFTIVSVLFDPHPKNISRLKLIIESLEKELLKSINERAFEEIKNDLNLAKNELNKLEEEINKYGLRDIDIVLYRKTLGKLIDGHDDIRALFFGLKPWDIKELDDLEKLPHQISEPESLEECHNLFKQMGHRSTKEKELLVEYIIS